jgi:hypothetical protein
MKKTGIFILIIVLSSCVVQRYVEVNEVSFIPNDTKKLNVQIYLTEFERMLRNENIHYQLNDQGLTTDIFLLDEYTRAYYDVFEDEKKLSIYCYWGITDQLESTIALTNDAIIGAGSGAGYRNDDMYRVVYKKGQARPKMVFDYMVTMLQKNGIQFSWE